MRIEVGSKVLITTNEWFYAADGRSYRAVWGTVAAINSSEDTLGVRTNARSTNWYVQIGDMLVAGCQIHYVCAAPEPPPMTVRDHSIKDGEVLPFMRPTHCWNADASPEGDNNAG